MEALSKTDLSAINFYWKFLQFIPENVKLGLAAKLTTSVLEDTTTEEPEKKPDDYTARMLDKFWGAWVGDETAVFLQGKSTAILCRLLYKQRKLQGSTD